MAQGVGAQGGQRAQARAELWAYAAELLCNLRPPQCNRRHGHALLQRTYQGANQTRAASIWRRACAARVAAAVAGQIRNMLGPRARSLHPVYPPLSGRVRSNAQHWPWPAGRAPLLTHKPTPDFHGVARPARARGGPTARGPRAPARRARMVWHGRAHARHAAIRSPYPRWEGVCHVGARGLVAPVPEADAAVEARGGPSFIDERGSTTTTPPHTDGEDEFGVPPKERARQGAACPPHLAAAKHRQVDAPIGHTLELVGPGSCFARTQEAARAPRPRQVAIDIGGARLGTRQCGCRPQARPRMC